MRFKATLNTLKEFRLNWNLCREDAWQDDAYNNYEVNNHEWCAPPTREFGLTAINFIALLYRIARCDLLGHRWQCTSYSAEHGMEHIECRTCGESHTLWH